MSHMGVVMAMSIPSVVSLIIQKNRMYRFHFPVFHVPPDLTVPQYLGGDGVVGDGGGC